MTRPRPHPLYAVTLSLFFPLFAAEGQESRDWLGEARALKSAHPLESYGYTRSFTFRSADRVRMLVGEHSAGKTGKDAWTLLKAEDGEGKPLDKDGERLGELDMDMPTYAEMMESLDDAEFVRETESIAVYTTETFRSDNVNVNIGVPGSDDESLPGEIVVRKQSPLGPYVESVSVSLPEAGGVPLLATLDALDLSFGYAVEPGSNGVLPTRMHIKVEGRAVYFINYDVDVSVTNAGFHLPAKAAEQTEQEGS